VGNSGGDAGLTRLENTTGTGGESQEETWAEGQEENGGHDEIGLGENETHSASDETVHEEEHERVEHNRHLAGLSVAESELLAVSGQKNTWAEREKKGGWYSNFVGSDIGEHLIYIHIIIHIVNKMVECSTPHHLLVKTIRVYKSSEGFPDVMKIFVIFKCNTFLVRVMLHVTKFNKITNFSRVFNTGVICKCINHTPHIP